MALNPTQDLRRRLRRQRAALTDQEQKQFAKQMIKHLRKTRIFRNAKHIALYWPVRGEADPRAIRRFALPHQRFYLPVATKHSRQMLFIEWNAATRFKPNRFHIPEPYPQFPPYPARCLDLVITPLVAFDSLGSRLGMGGGFYDTTFMFKRYSYSPQRPRLLGFAYDFQQVEKLESNPWDVALDAVLTEVGFLPFSAGLY